MTKKILTWVLYIAVGCWAVYDWHETESQRKGEIDSLRHSVGLLEAKIDTLENDCADDDDLEALKSRVDDLELK